MLMRQKRMMTSIWIEVKVGKNWTHTHTHAHTHTHTHIYIYIIVGTSHLLFNYTKPYPLHTAFGHFRFLLKHCLVHLWCCIHFCNFPKVPTKWVVSGFTIFPGTFGPNKFTQGDLQKHIKI